MGGLGTVAHICIYYNHQRPNLGIIELWPHIYILNNKISSVFLDLDEFVVPATSILISLVDSFRFWKIEGNNNPC